MSDNDETKIEFTMKEPPADVAGEVTLTPQEVKEDDGTSPNNR